MKSLKKLLVCGAALFCLVGCGKVSQKYADKINEAAQSESEKDDYTLAKIEKDLGEGSGLLIAGAGVKVWTITDKDGKVTATLTVTFVNSKATLAVFAE